MTLKSNIYPTVLVFFLGGLMSPVQGEEVLTVRQALWKILESLEMASLVEGAAALVFCLIIGTIVYKIQQEAKLTIKTIHLIAADTVQLTERTRR